MSIDKEAGPTMSYSQPTSNPTLLNSPQVAGAGTAALGGSGAGLLASGSSVETYEPRTPHQNYSYPHRTEEEKIAYHMTPQHPKENEMATSANVWELDGREMREPSELESPSIYQSSDRPPWDERQGDIDGGRHMGNEYGGSPVSPISPIEPRRF